MATDPALSLLLRRHADRRPGAREELIAHLSHLARAAVRKNGLEGELAKDCEQEALLTLIGCVDRIDPARLEVAAGMIWANVFRRPQKVAGAEQRASGLRKDPRPWWRTGWGPGVYLCRACGRPLWSKWEPPDECPTCRNAAAEPRANLALDALPEGVLPPALCTGGQERAGMREVVAAEGIQILRAGGARDRRRGLVLAMYLRGAELAEIARALCCSRARTGLLMDRAMERFNEVAGLAILEKRDELKFREKKPRGRPPGTTRGRRYPAKCSFHADAEIRQILQRAALDSNCAESEVIRRAIRAYVREGAAQP